MKLIGFRMERHGIDILLDMLLLRQRSSQMKAKAIARPEWHSCSSAAGDPLEPGTRSEQAPQSALLAATPWLRRGNLGGPLAASTGKRISDAE